MRVEEGKGDPKTKMSKCGREKEGEKEKHFNDFGVGVGADP